MRLRMQLNHLRPRTIGAFSLGAKNTRSKSSRSWCDLARSFTKFGLEGGVFGDAVVITHITTAEVGGPNANRIPQLS